MSRGQKRRTPENFPRMKDRAAGRRAHKAQREAFYTLYGDPDFSPRFGRALAAMAEALRVACAEIGRAYAEAMAEVTRGLQFPRPVLSIPAVAVPTQRHPVDAVIDAINGLEADEIGERVRWQLEEGMRRGDHLRGPWAAARRRRFVPVDSADLTRGTLVMDVEDSEVPW